MSARKCKWTEKRVKIKQKKSTKMSNVQKQRCQRSEETCKKTKPRQKFTKMTTERC